MLYAQQQYRLLSTSRRPPRLLLPSPVFSTPSTERSSSSSSCLDLFLQRCTSPRQARQVHAQLLLSPSPTHSAFLYARLVSVYGHLDLLPDARAAFRTALLPHTSLLWNSILRATLTHGHAEEALSLYCRLRATPTLPDGFTFPLVIRACATVGDPRLCSAVHNHAVALGYQSHLHVANELLVMYGNLGRMDLARLVFDAMPQRNIVSWNTLVSGFTLNGDCESARHVFRLMESIGCVPNAVTWTSLLSSHARCHRHDEVIVLFDEMRRNGIEATAQSVAVALSVCPYVADAPLDKGKMIHGYAIKSGYEGYSFVRNSLICMYGRLGNRDDAETLFSQTETKNLVSWNALISSYAASGLCHEAYDVFIQLERDGEVVPNLVSWSAVIGGFATQGMVEQSMELFRRMLRAGIRPNAITVATVLTACAESSALRLGKEIHGHAIRALVDRNLLVGNGLLNMYAKSGSVRDGHLVFNRIEDKDLITWNSLITGYGMHGLCEKALATFNDMVRAGFKPDEVTFVALLSACSHAGCISEGRQVFEQMVHEYKLLPWMEHYACMVDLLGRAGLLREACELVESMPMKPNACVWGALLNSCRMYGNTRVAEDTAMRVFRLEAKATGSYMLLSNIYAALGRWEDSRRVRVLTKAKGLKKNPGQSWIEVRKKVYKFSSGSTLPPGAEESFEVLDDLKRVMEIENSIDNHRSWSCYEDKEGEGVVGV